MRTRADLASAAVATLLLLPAEADAAQDSPVTGARVSVIERSTGALAVTLENLREAPLVAWQVGAVPPGASDPGPVHTADHSHPGSFAPDTGPLAPDGRRRVNISLDNPAAGWTAVVLLAVFADGYYEGTPAAVEQLRQRRWAQADDLRYWITALKEMPPQSDHARVFLRDALARHAARFGTPGTGFAQTLRSLAAEDTPRPPGWLVAVLKHRAAEAQAHLARLDQPLRGAPESRVVSVAVSSSVTTVGRLAALVENLRNVPIEAIGLRYPSGEMTADYCGSVVPFPGQGSIIPGETREMLRPSLSRNADGTWPDVTLSYVMFADLTFEGRREARDELLRERERRAAARAFWSAVLSEALLQPPDQVPAFLESKKRQRAVATASTREGPGGAPEIDQLIARAKTAPHEVAALASEMIGVFERQRAQCLGHQAR